MIFIILTKRETSDMLLFPNSVKYSVECAMITSVNTFCARHTTDVKYKLGAELNVKPPGAISPTGQTI